MTQPEGVVDRSFGTAMLAVFLADEFPVNREKVVRMVLVHDLGESIVGDLTPFDGYTKEEKHAKEKAAFAEISRNVAVGAESMSLWDKYERSETPEAKFVHALDKLEMLFQAHAYGVKQPELDLEQFWDYGKTFDFGDLKEIFVFLKDRRTK